MNKVWSSSANLRAEFPRCQLRFESMQMALGAFNGQDFDREEKCSTKQQMQIQDETLNSSGWTGCWSGLRCSLRLMGLGLAQAGLRLG